jgi:hypothetical protein
LKWAALCIRWWHGALDGGEQLRQGIEDGIAPEAERAGVIRRCRGVRDCRAMRLAMTAGLAKHAKNAPTGDRP